MFPSSSEQCILYQTCPYPKYGQLNTVSPRSFFGKGKLLFRLQDKVNGLVLIIMLVKTEVYDKNRIGIPVATIQIDVDSVLFLDRIESQVIRWHKNAIFEYFSPYAHSFIRTNTL